MLRIDKWRITFTFCVLSLIVGTGANCWANEGASKQSEDVYQILERFHGHVCAGSLMGARLGLAARGALERVGIQGKLKAQYFLLSCPIDGIQVTAGTTYGNRAIEVKDRNENRLLLSDEKGSRQVEACLTMGAEDKAKPSREMTRKLRTLPAGSPERRKLEQGVDAIYAWLKTAPEAEVVTVKFVR